MTFFSEVQHHYVFIFGTHSHITSASRNLKVISEKSRWINSCIDLERRNQRKRHTKKHNCHPRKAPNPFRAKYLTTGSHRYHRCRSKKRKRVQEYIGDQITIILLIIDPISRKFQLLRIEFNTNKLTVANIL